MLEKGDQLNYVGLELDKLLTKFTNNGFDPLTVYLTLYSYTVRLRSAIITSGTRDEAFMKQAESLTMKGLAIDKREQERLDASGKSQTRYGT